MNPSTLISALNGAAPNSATSRHAQLEKQAGNLVAQTFFGTLLKQMRESPFKDEMFSGGRGGEAFGSMYDQHLAEHMSRGVGRKLVNSIVKRLEA
ncbi:MAG: rod-binding protein, partial [Anaerolineae bacterium]|nr:rod-binding protein [Phycisphaerae bacterium]